MTNLFAPSMAPKHLLALLLLLLLPELSTLFTISFASNVSASSTGMYPFTCSMNTNNYMCNSLLYHSSGLPIDQLAFFYSVNTSQIQKISHFNKQDYLVSVPCSCKDVNGTVGYFYDTTYKVKLNDTFNDVSSQIYSGQAWKVGGEEHDYVPDIQVPIHLVCGCDQSESQVIVTYTVQDQDTLQKIASVLSAKIGEIEKMNTILTQSPGFIDVGWVLFVPKEKKGIQGRGKWPKWTIVIVILSVVTLLSMCAFVIMFLRRKKFMKSHEEDQKVVGSKSLKASKSFSLQNHYLHNKNMEGVKVFDSERPLIYSLEEVDEATNNFDETRKIGEGGYGSVYFGLIGEQEVAIKKMRSNKSKEFFAELKVLCKIHHINVVELLGYASGDDHLYLVYEYIRYGSLSEHIHDPLLKGHQPLSWTARTQIALDSAKGIEYIHDHTKARYVHRDIKTSNILLDEGLRAKVADFGLAKLVGRTNEDDFIATRLVGTPGYLPPESVKELQVTTKTDVFAFGVVLSELITGHRALIRDNKEPRKMKSLITIVNKIFQDEDPKAALESIIDSNLKGSYPIEDVYKMAEIAEWCLSEDPLNRPEMREVVVELSKILMCSIEWEASLGGNSQVFSGVFNGR